MKTETGVSTTANVDFQNPANHAIRCDLSLSSGRDDTNSLDASPRSIFTVGTNNAFRILLDRIDNIALGPRETFHIPIAFCPEILARQEAQLRVIGRLPPGKTWSPDK